MTWLFRSRRGKRLIVYIYQSFFIITMCMEKHFKFSTTCLYILAGILGSYLLEMAFAKIASLRNFLIFSAGIIVLSIPILGRFATATLGCFFYPWIFAIPLFAIFNKEGYYSSYNLKFWEWKYQECYFTELHLPFSDPSPEAKLLFKDVKNLAVHYRDPQYWADENLEKFVYRNDIKFSEDIKYIYLSFADVLHNRWMSERSYGPSHLANEWHEFYMKFLDLCQQKGFITPIHSKAETDAEIMRWKSIVDDNSDIHNEEALLKLLGYCFVKGDFSEIKPNCAEDVKYINGSYIYEKANNKRDTVMMLQSLANTTTVRYAYIGTVDKFHPEWEDNCDLTGKRVLALAFNTRAGFYQIMSIELNDEHLLSNVTVKEIAEYSVSIEEPEHCESDEYSYLSLIANGLNSKDCSRLINYFDHDIKYTDPTVTDPAFKKTKIGNYSALKYLDKMLETNTDTKAFLIETKEQDKKGVALSFGDSNEFKILIFISISNAKIISLEIVENNYPFLKLL